MVGSKYITLERKSKAVLLYVHGSGEATVIDTYTSPSYAKHTKRPYTFNDRLFISTKYSGSGSLRYSEYDPRTLRVINRDRAKDDAFTSLKRYRAKPAYPKDPVIAIFQVGQSKGEKTELVAFEISNLDEYVPGSWANAVVDNKSAYWVSMSHRRGELAGQVWSFDLDNPSAELRAATFSMPQDIGEVVMVVDFDVDDGYVVIQPRYTGGDDSRLVIYDATTGKTEFHDTDFDIFDVSIIHLGE
jgi:hypothetical protein